LDLTAADYCRVLEDYLCRKNDGHLVRIVGPAFEQVCGWAERGVPLTIAQRGIDRYFERYYAKGPRRRPVRIEFCEADVLDVFDEWRRAVGASGVEPANGRSRAQAATPGRADAEPAGAPDRDDPAPASGSAGRPRSLPAHLDRVIARLTVLRAGADRSLDNLLDALVRELDASRAAASGSCAEARDVLLQRLAVLDRTLVDTARSHMDPSTLQRLTAEAEAELSPFRARMPADDFERSCAAWLDRAIRQRLRLPVLTFD
jgi:hypothetical protein